MVRLIVFLIRLRFGLHKYELFRFDNQKSKIECYYFSTHGLKKVCANGLIKYSNVKLNWLLNDKCTVKSVEDTEAISIMFRMNSHKENKA